MYIPDVMRHLISCVICKSEKPLFVAIGKDGSDSDQLEGPNVCPNCLPKLCEKATKIVNFGREHFEFLPGEISQNNKVLGQAFLAALHHRAKCFKENSNFGGLNLPEDINASQQTLFSSASFKPTMRYRRRCRVFIDRENVYERGTVFKCEFGSDLGSKSTSDNPDMIFYDNPKRVLINCLERNEVLEPDPYSLDMERYLSPFIKEGNKEVEDYMIKNKLPNKSGPGKFNEISFVFVLDHQAL